MTEGVLDIPVNRRLWLLFIIFAKIAAFVVGGGYVILPIVEQELVSRRKWLKSEEFVDMTAVVQMIPGIIAGNCAVYIGYRVAGVRGALCALAGVSAPSVLVILVIAMSLTSLPGEILNNVYVQGAFTGVKSAVCGLVLATAIRMGRKIFTGVFELIIGVAGFLAVCFFSIGPGFVMVSAALCGIAYVWFRRKLFNGKVKLK